MSKRIKRRILPRKRVAGGLTIGSVINCTDNTGARKLKIIQMPGYKGRRRRLPTIGIGDLAIASCREGTPDMRRQLFNVVIVRQVRPYRRIDGSWIQFEDNAAVILTPEGNLRGSDVKGPVAREAVNRWARLGNVARMVV
jgi:large subunit ribosomal protein L14